ncbi:hypothetical protein FBR05_14535, partial [Deltaproteobacteria bacterium PRO3]|nr:hypothetical protein [Deltaproteobacteria bacterium PRO3]
MDPLFRRPAGPVSGIENEVRPHRPAAQARRARAHRPFLVPGPGGDRSAGGAEVRLDGQAPGLRPPRAGGRLPGGPAPRPPDLSQGLGKKLRRAFGGDRRRPRPAPRRLGQHRQPALRQGLERDRHGALSPDQDLRRGLRPRAGRQAALLQDLEARDVPSGLAAPRRVERGGPALSLHGAAMDVGGSHGAGRAATRGGGGASLGPAQRVGRRMREFRRDIPMPAPGRLAALAAAAAPACWLDSALPGHPRARHSLLALRPLRVFQAEAAELEPRLRQWDAWLRSWSGRIESEAFFSGGLVGYLSYPEGRFSAPLPAAQFFLFDSGIRIDAVRGSAEVFSLGLREHLSGADPALAEARCLELEGLVRSAPEAVARAPRLTSLCAELSRESYLSKVKDIRERILRGDCYQVNFSQRFVATGDWNPAELYLRLRSASPAPQMAFLNLGHGQILSASPETLLEVEGRRACSLPIKGTRPRGADP